MKQTCLLHFGPLPSYLRKSPLGHPAATNHFFSSKNNPSLDPLNSSFTYVWPRAYSSNLVNWSRPICFLFVICLVLWNITILEPSTHIHPTRNQHQDHTLTMCPGILPLGKFESSDEMKQTCLLHLKWSRYVYFLRHIPTELYSALQNSILRFTTYDWRIYKGKLQRAAKSWA